MKYNKYRIELSKVKKYAVLNKESDFERKTQKIL